jgi:hypothetical protein
MLARLKNWLNNKFSTGNSTSADRSKRTGTHVGAQPAQTVSPNNSPARNKSAREDTATDETLTILDSPITDPDEEAGIDPYNTGGFDRSKNWNKSFRK